MEVVPNFLSVLVIQGMVYVELNELDKALEIYNRIIKNNPLFEKAIALLQKIQKKKGDTKEEIEFERYQGLKLRKYQKSFLVELERRLDKPLPALEYIDYDDLFGVSGFVSKAGYITELGLDMKVIREIPESIGSLKYLKKLSITHCYNLVKLPDNITKLQYLKKFKFDYNPLSKIQPNHLSQEKTALMLLDTKICELKSLRKLNLKDSLIISELPKCLGDLPNLNEINITNCQKLKELPDNIKLNFRFTGSGHQKILKKIKRAESKIGELAKKKKVGIYQGQKLATEEIKFLEELEKQTLRTLNVLEKRDYRNNGFIVKNNHIVEMNLRDLEYIPESIENLHHIEGFKLYECSKIHALPESIGNLKTLKKFHLTSCFGLDKLPDSFGNLEMLEEFVMRACRGITSLPESFGNLKSLKKIHLSLINYFNLPESIGNLSSLKEMILEGSQIIGDVPMSMKNIDSLRKIELSISFSSETLPKGISSLKNLEELVIKGKTNLKSLGQIGNLESLKILDINVYNFILDLPENFGNLKKLKSLNLGSFMELSRLPDSFCELENLEEFTLRSIPKLTALPLLFGNLSNLIKFNIFYCQQIDKFPKSIDRLRSLEELRVENCNFKLIPLSLTRLNNLKLVSFLNNPLSFEDLFEKIKKGNYKEEEILDQVKVLVAGLQQDKISLKKEILILFESLIKKHLLITSFREKYFEICRYSIENEQNKEIKDISIKLFFKYFFKFNYFFEEGVDLIKSVIKSEKSILNIRTLLECLESTKDLRRLKRALLNRLSALFLAIPEESEAILKIEALKLPQHTNLLLEDDFFKLYGRYTYNELLLDIPPRYKKPFYNIENGHVTGVRLDSKGLTSVPEFLRDLSHIQYLDLSSNKLKILPGWLGTFSQLKILNLSNNFLTEIPENIHKIRTLKTIKVNNNPMLKKISPQILESTIKNYLNLGVFPSNAIILGRFEILYGLPFIKLGIGQDIEKIQLAHHFKLDESGHVIGFYIHGIENIWFKNIPHFIASLSSLQELEISDNYYISSIPDSINKLKKLRYLKLKNNNILEIPEFLFKLPNLVSLNLSGNHIETLPKNIEKLEKLKTIELSSNQIKILPSVLNNLKDLTFLGLDNNVIEIIPDSLGSLIGLKRLYLSFNTIKKIPLSLFNLTSLESLGLSGNKIQVIPNEIEILVNLNELYFMGNSIKEIPKSIGDLKKLTKLDFSDNKLTTVPKSLEKLEFLRFLDLSFNDIESHPLIENKVKNFVMKKKVRPAYLDL